MNFRIESIPSEIASQVRQHMVSPQYKSLPAISSVADGYGPCRSCLRVFDQGRDRRIYFTYDAFDGLSNLPDPGPVFIHEDDCEPFEGDFPKDLLDLPVYFEVYGDDSRMIQRERMDKSGVDVQLARLLSVHDAKFVNLRNAEAGCHIARALLVE